MTDVSTGSKKEVRITDSVCTLLCELVRMVMHQLSHDILRRPNVGPTQTSFLWLYEENEARDKRQIETKCDMQSKQSNRQTH
jgi:gamma-glutamyl:cysteine ligase YbdK (ATP-grasp superfamily)